MANHSSFFDVFAILGHLDVQFRWIVKKKLFHIPLLGLAMKRTGYISIDRGNHKKAMESIDFAAEKIRSGTSIVIFPEGTRSEDDSLRSPFKKGGMIIKPGTIKLVISKPIYPHCQRVDSLMEEVYRAITLPMGSCSTVGSEFV
ncbi:MAG: lysophospholipid acyltransferase family protein [Desulfomonilia bacterium]